MLRFASVCMASYKEKVLWCLPGETSWRELIRGRPSSTPVNSTSVLQPLSFPLFQPITLQHFFFSHNLKSIIAYNIHPRQLPYQCLQGIFCPVPSGEENVDALSSKHCGGDVSAFSPMARARAHRPNGSTCWLPIAMDD